MVRRFILKQKSNQFYFLLVFISFYSLLVGVLKYVGGFKKSQLFLKILNFLSKKSDEFSILMYRVKISGQSNKNCKNNRERKFEKVHFEKNAFQVFVTHSFIHSTLCYIDSSIINTF